MVALLLSHLWWKLLSADNLVFTFICRGSQIEENCYLDTFLFVQSHFKILEYMILGQFYSTPPNIFLVGFRWDGHYGPEMGRMDPTCRHPKPRPTNHRDFWTHHNFRTKMEFLFKDAFKNYVLNHFLYWKERKSCSHPHPEVTLVGSFSGPWSGHVWHMEESKDALSCLQWDYNSVSIHHQNCALFSLYHPGLQ